MNDQVNIFFAGDFCSKPSTSIIYVEEELVSLVRSCDYSVVNFEVPLRPDITLPFQNYERFYQHDDVPQFLRSLGFNLFTMATNHTFDWSVEGYLKTKMALGDDGFGAGKRDEAYSVKVVEKNGVKVGFLSLTYASKYGVFDDVMSDKEYGCAFVNALCVNHIIMDAKCKVDYLFVLPHDGIEYIDVPIPEIRARYHDFIDYGADAVIGTHPHCPQGWEEYNGKPIFYSLGNFFFNSKTDPSYRAWNRPHWYEGLCVVFTIGCNGVSYSIVNTRNTDNVRIGVEHTEVREQHNAKLCNLLSDNKQYSEYLNSSFADLWAKQESIVLDWVIHKSNIFNMWKLLIKSSLKMLLNKYRQDDSSIIMLLKNDSRRNVVRRFLENNYN